MKKISIKIEYTWVRIFEDEDYSNIIFDEKPESFIDEYKFVGETLDVPVSIEDDMWDNLRTNAGDLRVVLEKANEHGSAVKHYVSQEGDSLTCDRWITIEVTNSENDDKLEKVKKLIVENKMEAFIVMPPAKVGQTIEFTLDADDIGEGYRHFSVYVNDGMDAYSFEITGHPSDPDFMSYEGSLPEYFDIFWQKLPNS